jgi:Flp pilus assembly protein TadD
MRDPAQALVHAERARELSPSDQWQVLDTLAAALAANGRFEEAVARQEEALRLVDDENRAEAEKHLALYRQGQACVE